MVITNLKIQCPEELLQYCLRSLGHPVINIEIDDQQAYDRIFDGIQNFIKRHHDGCTEVWTAYQISQTDVDRGYLTIPEKISTIVDLIDPNGTSGNSGTSVPHLDDFNFRLVQTDFFNQIFDNSNGSSVVSYHIAMENLEMIKRYFSPTRKFRFNAITKRLWLSDNKSIRSGMVIILHGYESLDPDRDMDLYNDEFLKKYCTALIGKQWGKNISKFSGIQMPGGVTMNGERIYDMYNAEVEKYETQLKEELEEPAMFFMG